MSGHDEHPELERRSSRELRHRMLRFRDAEQTELAQWLASRSTDPRWRAAAFCWQELRAIAPGLPTPAALETQDGTAQLAWSLRDYHVELETDVTGGLEWYAQDRRTRRDASGSSTERDLPRELIAWIRRVSSADN